MTDATRHMPVMADEVLAALDPHDGEVIVDGTFGGGGYAMAVMQAADCRVVGIDRDPDAIARGEMLRASSGGRLTLISGAFGAMDTLVAQAGFSGADGVTLDLGVSSDQIDRADRGFSFQVDGPLDMRMSAEGPSAADAVNSLDADAIARILWLYGEEKKSRALARAIITARGEAPILRTRQLAAVCERVLGRSHDGPHPATRTFQALRIYVNDELGQLVRGLSAAERLLRPRGRLAVVSFHSLEDRIVKNFMNARAGRVSNPSRHAPAAPHASIAPSFALMRKGAQTASVEELRRNPRARSAKLRTAQRTHAAPFASNDDMLSQLPEIPS